MIVGTLEIQLMADIARLTRDMGAARQVVTRATDGMERAANAARSALAGIGAGLGLSQLVQMSDAYAKFTAQLRLASSSVREYGAAYADVKRIAKDSQQGLGETGILYARIANGTRELGTTQKQVAAITETVNMALKVSGATASESASAQLQLSQAFASGTLRGEEFNAVNEAAPRLMLALADGIGVPVGALKKMAENGLITSAIMADVLPKALEKVREEAKQIQTIAGAFTVLKNNLMEFVGIQANASGAVATLTGAIGFLADNLVLIAGAVATLTTAKLASWLANMVTSTYSAVAANRTLATSTLAAAVSTTEAAAVTSAAKLAEAQANVRAAASSSALANARVNELRAAVLAARGPAALAIATNGLIPAQARAIALAEAHAKALAGQAVAGNAATVAAGAHTAAISAQAAAATLGARAMGLLRGAVGFLGGPIGAITTLLGIGATAWMVWGNKGSQAEKLVADTLAEEIDDYLANLNKQIEKLKERNELAGKGMTSAAAPVTDHDKRREQIVAEINRISKQTDLDVATKTEMLRVWGAKLNSVAVDMGKLTAEQQRNKDLAFATKYPDWLGKYGTAAQKIAFDLEVLRKEYGRVTPAMEAHVRAQHADKGAAAAIKQEATAYQSLVTSIGEKIAANKLELAGHDKLTDAQKMTIKLDEAITTGKSKLTPKHVAEARAMIETVGAQDKALLAKKQAIEMDQIRIGYGAALGKSIEDAVKEAEANELLVRAFGKTRSAIEQLEIARMEERLGKLRGIDMADDEVAALERLIEVKRRNAAAVVRLEVLDTGSDVTKAKELLDILTAVDTATKSAAAGMAESFGRVGSAIGGLTTALSGYAVQQQAIMAQLAAAKADPKNGPEKIAKLEIAAAQASAQAQMKSYGDMASASKSFFKENSKGYKVMEGAEKAFRAFEMAMMIKSMATSLFVTSAKATGAVAGQAVETGAVVAGEAARNVAKVPGVFMSFMSALGPWGMAAAGVAIAAVLGSAFSGNGGAPTPSFEEKQKTQGTGTVLGDDMAKSESIAKSLDMMEGYAALELDYQNSMLQALRNIEMALGGAAKGIMQTAGITGGSAFGTVNSASANFFGSDKSTTIDDTGVKFSGTFGDLRAGRGRGVQYEDVIKTSDGGWFHGDSTSRHTNTKNLSQEAMQPFALIFDNMGDLLVDAGVKLGRDSASLTDAINGIGINFEVSLRDLKGQELTDALNAGVSVAFDKVTKELFPTIAQFQKMGEGIGETLVRVATDVKAVDSVFAAMGKSTLHSVTTTVGGWLGIVYGTGTKISEMSIEAKTLLVEAAGGLDKFATSASSFMRNFYSDAEQNAATKARLQPVLAAVGLSTEGHNAQKMFRDFVIGLDTSTASGRETYAMLMDVQQAFKDVTSAAADERADLLDQLDELTLSEIQLLNKQRMALDASNRGLFDHVQLIKAAKTAQDEAKSSLGDVISKMKSFGDSARSLRDGLVTGSLSTLTPEQQYAELERQYQTTRMAGIAGDSKAQANFASIAQSFLTASQKINGGDARYSTDFAGVLRDSEEIAKWTTAQVDVAQASLDAMNAQVVGINTLNDSVLLLVEQGAGAMPSSIATPDYSRMGTSDKDALVAEIKLLNSKLDAQTKVMEEWRAEQQTQTGDLIASNDQISRRDANKVVDGTHTAIAEAARHERYRHGAPIDGY